MKRFFTVTNEEGQAISVLQFTDNHNFDSLLMQSIAEHYTAEDVAMDQGFNIDDYHGKPLIIQATVYDDSGDFKEGFKIEEVAVYQNYKKRYFIFGSQPVAEYAENQKVEDVTLPMDGKTYVFNLLEDDIADLLEAYNGWGGYWEINEEEYNYLNSK